MGEIYRSCGNLAWSDPAHIREQTLVCLMVEEMEAIENLPDLVTVAGVDVYFIGSGDLSQSMGLTGQQAHPDVQHAMERGVKIITGAGRIAGCSCPDNLIPKFLGLGRAVLPQRREPTAPAEQRGLSEDDASGRGRRREVMTPSCRAERVGLTSARTRYSCTRPRWRNY